MNLEHLTIDELYSERDAAWYNLQSLTASDPGYTRAERQMTDVKMEINRRIARQMADAVRRLAVAA